LGSQNPRVQELMTAVSKKLEWVQLDAFESLLAALRVLIHFPADFRFTYFFVAFIFLTFFVVSDSLYDVLFGFVSAPVDFV
jgi:hypothetical protein